MVHTHHLAINLRNARLSGLWFLGVAHEGSLVASDHCEGVGGVDIDTDRGLATLVIGVSHEPAAWLGCWVAWASLITVDLTVHSIITSTDLLTANLPGLSLLVRYSIVHTECWHWWGVGSGGESGPWSSCGWDDGRAIRERTAWVVGVVLQFAGQWNLVQVGAPFCAHVSSSH